MISFTKAIEIHKESIIKNGATEGFFNVFVFRKISIVLSWILANFHINPNLITTISFLLNILGGILLLINFESNKVISIILIALGFILDMCDGEVARILNKKSQFGAFYDPFLDRITDIILPLLIGLGFCIYKPSYTIVVILFTVLYVGIRVAIICLEQTNFKLGLTPSIDTVRKFTSMDNFLIWKYIKWDGGFTIILLSISIYFEIIIPLLIFLCIFFGIIMFMGFIKISKKLNN